MDIEERTRLAAAMVPKPGMAKYAGAAWLLGLCVFVGGALHAISRVDEVPTTGLIVTVLALIALGVLLVAFTFELLIQLRAHRAAGEWITKGNLDRGSQGQFALLERRWMFPEWRASFATSLATTALMAGHPERAIVLFRAIAASNTTPRMYQRTLRDRTALTLLALRQVAAARIMVAEEETTKSWWGEALQPTKVKLLIEAVAGSLEAAVAEAERAEESFRVPILAPRKSDMQAQRAYGWLVIAYVWERVVRSKPPEGCLEVERRRDAAIAQARDVPPYFYRYLAPVGEDFVAFADRFASS